jgi:hypothetical protein
MKKLIYVLPVLALFAVLVGFGISQGDPNADSSPTLNNEVWNSEMQSDTIRPGNFPFPTQWNFYHANVTGLNGGTVGAMLLFNQYYMNWWSSTACYILPNTGANFGPSTVGMRNVVYTGNVRDMATDGRYLYGGKASTILYKMDTNMTTLNQFTLSGVIRAIAYDRSRRAFWISDFGGAITCRDTANVLKGTITSTQTGKYGMGFDSTNAGDSAFLYVWSQTAILERYYLTPATPTLVNTWTFTAIAPAIAGGAEVCTDFSVTPPRVMLLLNYQNFAVVGYKIKDAVLGLQQSNEIVRDFVLNQNYPNPFNPVTNISFTLRNAERVKITLFNSVGEKIKTIVDGHYTAGDHEFVYDASGLASGVYFYQLEAADYKDTKKMMLVK